MRCQKWHREAPERCQTALLRLAEEALREISKLPSPVIQFCAPISTGGFGNVTENLENLRSAIETTTERGIPVFNQLSYEGQMDRILKESHEYDYPLLDFFYKPILLSRKISGLVFLPLWETSFGSNWEHKFAESLSLPIFHMEKMLASEIEHFYKTLL